MHSSRNQLSFTNNWDEFVEGLSLSKEFHKEQDFNVFPHHVFVHRADGRVDMLPEFIIEANKRRPKHRSIKYAHLQEVEIIAWRWSNASSKSIVINRRNNLFYEAESRWLDSYPCIVKKSDSYFINESIIENTLLIQDKIFFMGGTINPSHFFGEYLPKLAIMDEPVSILLWDDAEWIREAIRYVQPKAKIKIIDLNPITKLYCTRILLSQCILVEDILDNLEFGLEISRMLISGGIKASIEADSVPKILPFMPSICHLSRLRFETIVNARKSSYDPTRPHRIHNYSHFLGLIRQAKGKTLFPETYSLRTVHDYIACADIVVCEYGSLFAHLLINKFFHERLHSGLVKLLFLVPKRFLDNHDDFTLAEHRWWKSLNCRNLIFLEGFPLFGLPSMSGANYNDPCIYAKNTRSVLDLISMTQSEKF